MYANVPALTLISITTIIFMSIAKRWLKAGITAAFAVAMLLSAASVARADGTSAPAGWFSVATTAFDNNTGDAEFLITGNGIAVTNVYVIAYGAPSGIYLDESGALGSGATYAVTNGSGDYGTYYFVGFNSAQRLAGDIDFCQGVTYADCIAAYPSAEQFSITFNPPAPPSGFGTMLSSSEDGFNSTTGFSPADLVGWTGTNLTSVFIGSGLALLYYLRYWILALIIIASIVYFSYRAMQFFRH